MVKDILAQAPPKVRRCLVKILKLKYNERPPYEELLNTLKDCFVDEIIHDFDASGPSAAEYGNGNIDSFEDYEFEWNREALARRELPAERVNSNERSQNVALSVVLTKNSGAAAASGLSDDSSLRNFKSMCSS